VKKDKTSGLDFPNKELRLLFDRDISSEVQLSVLGIDVARFMCWLDGRGQAISKSLSKKSNRFAKIFIITELIAGRNAPQLRLVIIEELLERKVAAPV
jgi:hypothetical protein